MVVAIPDIDLKYPGFNPWFEIQGLNPWSYYWMIPSKIFIMKNTV